MKTQWIAALIMATALGVCCLGILPAAGGGRCPSANNATTMPAFAQIAPHAEQAFAAGESIQAAQLAKANKKLSAQATTIKTTTNATKPKKPTKAQYRAFKRASANFSLELFKRCVRAKSKKANVTIAPMSVMNALALTANGAKGKTAAQMRKVLGDGALMAHMNKSLRWFNSRLTNVKKARISSANSIWYHDDNSLIMRKKFLLRAKKYYNAEINPADFSNSETVADINNWVSEKTNSMIKKIIQQLDPTDRIAIINALYFDAQWREPYEKESVHTRTFTASNGTKRKVKMMYSTEYKYIEGEHVRGFIKPYARGYSYVALLPEKGLSLKKFVSTLDGDAFRKLIASAQNQTVRAGLPKYSLSYTNEGMEKQLSAMGITAAFGKKANFSRMAVDKKGNLFIGSVAHKTKIDVDEQGTKAAAVTAVMARNSSAFIGPIKKVTLNRPFVYAIVDNKTKLPVFIGAVNTLGEN